MEQAVFAFATEGTPISCECFGSGHINSTYAVTTDAGRRYVLQKINTHVFTKPRELMENINAVTGHLAAKGRVTLHFLCADGQPYYENETGFWRLYEFIDGFCSDAPESPEDFYESAVAFGAFQKDLADFPAETLHEIIPGFHNTPHRFRKLKEAITRDTAGRCRDAQPEIQAALAMEQEGSRLQAMLEAGKLPLRVTHNDTKLNNVLLNRETRKGLCVIDLDTVMPGLAAYDFGDSIRFGAATAAEDEPDTDKMSMDLDLFRVYAKGFLQEATTLTDGEAESLPLGAFTMALEVGIRFLTDYLDGDVYFRTAYAEHNLVRCRTQLRLAADMLQKMPQMHAIVKEYR